MYGHTRRDMIRNEYIQDKVGVASMEKKEVRGEVEMVRACGEEMHGCPSVEMWKVGYGLF